MPLSRHPSTGGLYVQNAGFRSPYAKSLIRAGAAVAGYANLEAADFPVKLGYINAD